MRRTAAVLQADRRTRHHMMVDGQMNPREWFNWHPREFQPWFYDKHKWQYEQHQYAHVHHLLCHQVYLKDVLQLVQFPEPSTVILDTRMDPAKMHRWVPHSHWLPRDEIEYALQLSDEEFTDMYGFSKPDRGHDLIVVSHNGLASEQSGWELKKAYYRHVYNYRGGSNELFGEKYVDFPPVQALKPWKGPFPQSGLYTDVWSKRKVLTRTGPFDRQYELQDFALPDLEAERKRHPEAGPRTNVPYALR